MDTLNIDLWTFDVGAEVSSAEDYAELILKRVLKGWESGADMVVFPEFAWMGLERFIADRADLRQLSALFWEKIWPGMQLHFLDPGKAAVLGTVPYATPGGAVFNRAPVWCAGLPAWQDKIHLTPWEKALSGGDTLHVFTLGGIRFAVVICLDIEIPELSVLLRGRHVDVLIVPSATENLMGVERVNRCASARAVELGCYAGVCHLVGRTDSILVDENVGRLSCFTPSQSPFENELRESMSPVFEDGFHTRRIVIDRRKLDELRSNNSETNPSKVNVEGVFKVLVSEK